MASSLRAALDRLHPQMLRMRSEGDPQRLGEAAKSEIGQAFGYAIDRARVGKKALAADLGYTDQGVIGRWISGAERIQLDKLKACAPAVYAEFLLALLQMEDGVEVKTQVTFRVG